MTHFVRILALLIALALVAPVAYAGPCHDQPNMAAALVSLKEAKQRLQNAEHNKGGWREAALKAVNEAIQQTERGCAVAD